MKKILVLFLLCGIIFSKDITLKFLENKPKGTVRDFYIWQFITDKNTNIEDAKKAYELVNNKTPRIQKAMQDKGIPSLMPRDLMCKSFDFVKLSQEDGQCIVYGLKLSDILTHSDKDIQNIIQKITPINQDLAQQVKILISKNVVKELFETSPKNFANIFNGLSYAQKIKLFETKLSAKKIEKLANENYPAFNKVLNIIVLDPRFEDFKKALSKADIINSDTNTFFLLGINEIMQKNKSKALVYFKRSQDVGVDPFMIDRALFWRYLVSKNDLLLNELSKSGFVDIFSIYANQKLGSKPEYKIISKFDDISNKDPGFNIKDPFEWQILRTNILAINNEKEYNDLMKYFKYKKSLPHLVYFLNRSTKYKINYFITSYSDGIKWNDNQEKSMVYAIARQESHLLPASISSSYALGIMQIMPFNVEPFAKSMKIDKIEYSDMFDPKTALEFGKYYLDELKEEFKNPLFVSYAYNGGPGFLRRLLAKNQLFLKNREYEPWLSMELLPYEESRFYGMKVIANYIIYQGLFGNHVDLEKLLKQTLIYPKETK